MSKEDLSIRKKVRKEVKQTNKQFM